MKTANLVDGGFYRRRAQSRLGERTAEEKKRKFAIRLGKLADEQAQFLLLREDIVRKLCRGTLQVQDLKEQDFLLEVSQRTKLPSLDPIKNRPELPQSDRR